MSTTNRSVVTREPDGSVIVSGRNKNGVVTHHRRDRADRDHRAPARGPARQPVAEQRPRPRHRRQLRAQRAGGDRGAQGRSQAGQSRSSWRRPSPTSARTASRSPRRSTATPARSGNGWAVSPMTGDRALGDVRGRAAGRRARRDGADDQAAPQVLRPLDARPVPALGHPTRQADRPEPARGPPRRPGRRAEVRTEAQKNTLLAYFRVMDAELRAKTAALAAARAPLPVDAKLQELRGQLEFAKKPIQPDPALRDPAPRRRDERRAGRHPPAHRRPGHRLGADQQPGVPVQPLIEQRGFAHGSHECHGSGDGGVVRPGPWPRGMRQHDAVASGPWLDRSRPSPRST